MVSVSVFWRWSSMGPPTVLKIPGCFFVLASQMYLGSLDVHIPQGPKHGRTSSVNDFWSFKARGKEDKGSNIKKPNAYFPVTPVIPLGSCPCLLCRPSQQLGFQIIKRNGCFSSFRFWPHPPCPCPLCALLRFPGLLGCLCCLLYLHIESAVWPVSTSIFVLREVTCSALLLSSCLMMWPGFVIILPFVLVP